MRSIFDAGTILNQLGMQAGQVRAVMVLTSAGGRVRRTDAIADPGKLRHVSALLEERLSRTSA